MPSQDIMLLYVQQQKEEERRKKVIDAMAWRFRQDYKQPRRIS